MDILSETKGVLFLLRVLVTKRDFMTSSLSTYIYKLFVYLEYEMTIMKYFRCEIKNQTRFSKRNQTKIFSFEMNKSKHRS